MKVVCATQLAMRKRNARRGLIPWVTALHSHLVNHFRSERSEGPNRDQSLMVGVRDQSNHRLEGTRWVMRSMPPVEFN